MLLKPMSRYSNGMFSCPRSKPLKRKICVVVTARPSYSRIRTALKAIKADPELELQLVAASSAILDRYGNAVRYMEQDGFEIASRVYMVGNLRAKIALTKPSMPKIVAASTKVLSVTSGWYRWIFVKKSEMPSTITPTMKPRNTAPEM